MSPFWTHFHRRNRRPFPPQTRRHNSIFPRRLDLPSPEVKFQVVDREAGVRLPRRNIIYGTSGVYELCIFSAV